MISLVEEKLNNNFLIYLNLYYITQNFQNFLQWLFVSEMPCNPQTYGVWARYDPSPAFPLPKRHDYQESERLKKDLQLIEKELKNLVSDSKFDISSYSIETRGEREFRAF